jgi:hypothetical protein
MTARAAYQAVSSFQLFHSESDNYNIYQDVKRIFLRDKAKYDLQY